MKKTVLFIVCLVASILTKAQQPAFQWAKKMGGTAYDYGYSVAVDGSGNVYTTGSFSGTADFDPGAGAFNLTANPDGYGDIFISKLDVSGNFLWAKQIGGANNDVGYSIARDGAGNIYTTGTFSGTADFDPGAGTYNLTSNSVGNGDIFISKLDALGNFLWAKQIGGKYYDAGNSIVLDALGNVYTTGQFRDTVDFDPNAGVIDLIAFGGGVDIFISKLDASGNFLWAKQMGGANSVDVGNSIALDVLGNIYTTGFFTGTADFDPGAGTVNLTSGTIGYHDVFISKLDSSGNFVWVKQMGEPYSDIGYSNKVDASGNVYSTGLFLGTMDFDPGIGVSNLTSSGTSDIFISKLDAAGNFVWAKNIGGSNDDAGYSIAIDSSGNVYTTGFFKEMADFDPGAGTYYLTSTMNGAVYNSDAFVSKLDASGNFVWAENIGGTWDTYGYSIALDTFDNIYTTGYFKGTTDFDPSTGIFNLTDTGNNDIFVHKMSQTATGIETNTNRNDISVYPNPANNFIDIETDLKNCYFSLLDITGKLILREKIYQNKTRIDLSDYSTGLYFIQIQSDDKMTSKKFIKQ